MLRWPVVVFRDLGSTGLLVFTLWDMAGVLRLKAFDHSLFAKRSTYTSVRPADRIA